MGNHKNIKCEDCGVEMEPFEDSVTDEDQQSFSCPECGWSEEITLTDLRHATMSINGIPIEPVELKDLSINIKETE